MLGARHAGDTGSGDPGMNPLLNHPLKLAQLPRAGVRGRAQDPSLRRVAGVPPPPTAPQPQVTNSNPGSTEKPFGESRPKSETGSPRTPQTGPELRESGGRVPRWGSPSSPAPSPSTALSLSDPQRVELGARGEGSPRRLSTAPAGMRAGVEKAPLRLWRWANCGRSFSKFARARGVGRAPR